MTVLCIVALLVFGGVSFSAEKDDAVTAKEQMMWDLVKKGDLKTFASNLTEGMVDIEADGRILGKSEMMQNLEKFRTESFQLSNMKVQWINEDTALLTYNAAVKGTYEGKPVSGEFSCSSVWVKHGDNWVGHFHQETPIAPMPQQ